MAISKQLAGVLVLGAATGGPYALIQSGTLEGLGQTEQTEPQPPAGSPTAGWFTSATSDEWPSDRPPPQTLGDLHFEPQPLPSIASQTAIEQPRIQALQEVIRFDINPTWVLQRFPRVTTVLADLNLDGMRVPLVTGTHPTDLAGTLTYYFDRHKRVQRISLQGLTGDPSRFMAELQHVYQLQEQPALGGVLYLRKWNGKPASLVYAEPSGVITADDPFARFRMFVEINNASLEYGISAEAQEFLSHGKNANRWD